MVMMVVKLVMVVVMSTAIAKNTKQASNYLSRNYFKSFPTPSINSLRKKKKIIIK